MIHTFYFVRHGESILNAKGVRQGHEGSLSEKGFEQAKQAGLMLKDKKIKVIISSPYQRTKETAETIAKEIKYKKNIEYSDLLFERRNPKEIIGKYGSDPEIAKIIDQIDKSYHTDNYRYSDEENFEDMKIRAAALLSFLEKRKEKRILVVTHSIFLKLFISYLIYKDDLTAEGYNKLSYFNQSNNASVTTCTYRSGLSGLFRKEKWELISWDVHPTRWVPGSRKSEES